MMVHHHIKTAILFRCWNGIACDKRQGLALDYKYAGEYGSIDFYDSSFDVATVYEFEE